MGATSTEGTGPGASNKPTVTQLANWANGPSILLAGTTSSTSNEETYTGTVTFPTPLPGISNDPGSEYCVILTTVNGTYATITDLDDQDLDSDGEDDHFTGFSFETSNECDVMYIVTKFGQKPN